MKINLKDQYMIDIDRYKDSAEDLISYNEYYIQIFKNENDLYFAYILNKQGIVEYYNQELYNSVDDCLFNTKLLANNELSNKDKEYDFSNAEKNPYNKK